MKIFQIKLIILTLFILSSCGVKRNKSVANSTDAVISVPDENLNKAETPNASKIVYSQFDGSLLLTSENGSAIGPNIKYMPEESAFGWFTAADLVEWEVQVDHSGEYDVYLEWSVADAEAGKPYMLKAGNQELRGKVEKTGSWQTYKTKKIGAIKLDTGIQKLVFKPTSKFETKGDIGALMDLRKLTLVPVKNR